MKLYTKLTKSAKKFRSSPSLDELGDDARAIVLELERRHFHVLAYNCPKYELLIHPRANLTPEFIERIRPHVAEIVRFIFAGGGRREGAER